jgi:hypothetical protein
MKYIKQYEANYNQPKIGDYVLCELDPIDNADDNKLVSYIKNHIGIIIRKKPSEIEINNRHKLLYHIKYEGITQDDYEDDYSLAEDTDDTFLIWRKEIKHWSKNKEELEFILSVNKYNL